MMDRWMKGVLSAMIPFVVMGGCAAQGKTGAVSLSYDDFMKDKNGVKQGNEILAGVFLHAFL